MKKLLSVFLVLIIVFTLVFSTGVLEAGAASNIAGGTCGDNVEWWLTTEGVLHIEGKGAMDTWTWWSGGVYPQWKTHAASVKEVVIGKGVTNVGAFAFYGGYSNLTKVTLPSTVTSIGARAFVECTALETINIPSAVTSIGEYAFSGDINLTKITLPANLKTLGSNSFEKTGLTSITVPASIGALNGYSFSECDSLRTATIGVGKGSFDIGTYAFMGCDSLTTVTIGDAVSNIGSDSFSDCPKLKNLTIGNNVKTISSGFQNCTALEEVFIPDSVTTLRWGSFGYGSSFKGCTNLKKVIFGTGMETIDADAFSGCTSINEIYFMGDAPTFEGTETFKGCTIKGYYPKGNTTWKQSNLTNHGGFIDWNTFRPLTMRTPALKVSNNASTGKPVLSWAAVKGANNYDIYYSTSADGTYTKLASTKNLTYTHTAASTGKTYYYKIRATYGSVKSKYSSVIKRTCDCARPVTKLTVLSSRKPKISWSRISGAAKYSVYRAPSKTGTYKLIKTTTSLSYTDTSAVAGKVYYYKVRAISSKTSAADSAYSSVKSYTYKCAAPSVSITRSKGDPKLSWGKVTGAVKYGVYRSTSKNGTYSLKKTTTSTSYTDTSAVAGKTYYYKVKAIGSNTSANSAYSSIKYITAK